MAKCSAVAFKLWRRLTERTPPGATLDITEVTRDLGVSKTAAMRALAELEELRVLQTEEV